MGFVCGIDLPAWCRTLSLALSHGERGWVCREAKSGRETKNGSVVAWAMPAILLQRSSEVCIWVSTKLAAFVLTSLILRFQTTLLCLMLCGRGHSPRYFFLVLFRGRVLGRLKTGKAGFITAAVAWALPAELTYWFVLCPLPSPLPRGEGIEDTEIQPFLDFLPLGICQQIYPLSPWERVRERAVSASLL